MPDEFNYLLGALKSVEFPLSLFELLEKDKFDFMEFRDRVFGAPVQLAKVPDVQIFKRAIFGLPSGVFSCADLEAIIDCNLFEPSVRAAAKFGLTKARFGTNDVCPEVEHLHKRATLLTSGTLAISPTAISRFLQFGSCFEVCVVMSTTRVWESSVQMKYVQLFQFLAENSKTEEIAVQAIQSMEEVLKGACDRPSLQLLAGICANPEQDIGIKQVAYRALLIIEGFVDPLSIPLECDELEIDMTNLKDYL